MNVEALFAILDELSPEDRDRVEAYLAQQDKKHLVPSQRSQPSRDTERQRNRERVAAELDAAIDKFWGDSSEEEMKVILDAMRTKSTPAKNIP